MENLPNKVDFKSSLEIDKGSKQSSKKSFKASLLFSGKNNLNIIELFPSTVNELDVCPIPYIHPISYSKSANIKIYHMLVDGRTMTQ